MANVDLFLKARVVEEAIVIESNMPSFHGLLFVGCSEPTSALAGSEVPSLTVFPKLREGEEGLLVMRHPSRSATMIDATWPLRISSKEGKPWLHLGKGDWLWTCASEDRLGGVVNEHLEVRIDGKWYASEELRNKGYIPDPDLICRYLVGKAQKEDLLKVAQGVDEERLARQELRMALDVIRGLVQQKEALERTAETLYAENEQLKKGPSLN